MLKRAFTRTEEILLLVMTIALIGLCYYHFFYQKQIETRQSYDTATLEDQIMIEQAKAAQIQNMQDEIAENKAASTGVVQSYNNLKTEINNLNDIFAEALTFDFGFDQAYAEGDAVRRNINASFTAISYDNAKKMLTDLYNCEDRCLIRNISVSSISAEGYTGDDQNLNDGPVAVSFTVTFYETLYNATTTDGLNMDNSSWTPDDGSLINQLAESKEAAESME